MQFSAIRTYCATRFRDSSSVVVTDAQWKDYVNSAYGDALGSMTYFPWNERTTNITIAPNVRSGSLPTDAWAVTAVYDSTNQFPMVPLEGRDQVYSEYPQQTEVGQAMHFRIFNNSLQVYPLPQASTTYIVEYTGMPSDLVNDADLPVFPDQWHDILVAGAVAMAYKDDGNPQLAAQYQAEYESGLKALQSWANQARQPRFYEPVDTFM